MRIVWLAALALCATGSAVVAEQAHTGTIEHLQVATSDTSFPSYSREDQTRTCLYSYGVENTSVLDCVNDDGKYKNGLSARWASIAEDLKKDCLLRLAQRHLGSYFALDRCIQSLKANEASPN